MSFKKKLIVILMTLGLIPIIVLGIISITKAENALEHEAEIKLEGVTNLKIGNIRTYMDSVKSGMSAIGNSGDTARLFNKLVALHKKYDVQGDAPFDIVDKSDVKEVYAEYNEQFEKMVKDFHLYDIFVICKAHGHVMYTVAKESDLGANIGVGELKDSGLAEVWRKVVASKQIAFSDMRPYAPSNNAPSIFMGAPIMEKGEMLGVVAVQMDNSVLNNIMTNNAGLGETGQSYLVGGDYLMRSDLIEDMTNYSVAASFAKNNKTQTESVKRALNGESGIINAYDVMGDEVISAFAPLDFFGTKWAVIVDITMEEIDRPVVETRNIILISSAIFAVLILGIAIYFGNSIATPIISSVRTIAEANNQVVAASDQIAASSQSLAEGASEQASSVEEVSATVEESTATNNQNAENGREADNLARAAHESAKTGNHKVQELMTAMEKITDSSQRIAKIIKTIDEIAFQTNLLALNAAVEAARAGEHGLGFAVVADEVKNLAQRSADAAKETAGIIEEAIEEIKNGNQIAKATNESFAEILDKAKKTSDLIGEISASIKEQADGMNQIATAMGQIDQVTQQNAANSEEAAAAAEQLNAQALAMMESVHDIGRIVGYQAEEVHIHSVQKSEPKKLTKAPLKKRESVKLM